jgi:hypothetical protein
MPNADAMVRLEAALINWWEGYRPKPRDNITHPKDNTQSRSATFDVEQHGRRSIARTVF